LFTSAAPDDAARLTSTGDMARWQVGEDRGKNFGHTHHAYPGLSLLQKKL